jgi:hypothetical protein
MRMTGDKRAVSIVATVGMMLILSLLGIVGVTMFGSFSGSAVDCLQSQQTFYIAEAAAEWYLEKLQNDSDWTTPPSYPTQASPKNFAGGTFYIAVSNLATNSITITCTATITGYDSRSIKRVLTMNVARTGMVVSGFKEVL